MASAEPLVEIGERFYQCPICLEQYKQPKLLPCIHRYCRNCLEQLIQQNEGANMISCPECRGEFEVPREGVDGFKTDFHINSVIEYIQVKKSLQDEQLKECCKCLKKMKVISYCFKCNDFLCKECDNDHVPNKILKNHKRYTLSLEESRSKSLTLEKLAALKEAPRCQLHHENLSQLCCKTCNNFPICVTCTYGSHENHIIKDVSILAIEEKNKLNEQLEMLSQYKERMYKMSEKVDRVRTELFSSVKEKKEFYQTRYEKDVKTLETEMKKMTGNKRIQETEITTKIDIHLTEARQKMEKELEGVRQKYGSICDEIRRENEAKVRELKEKYNSQLQKNKEKLKRLEIDFQGLVASMEKKQKELEKQLEAISLHIDGTTKRFENLTATARSIIDTENDWTAVKCIPDILLASEPLRAQMNREISELEMMSQIEITVEITLDEVSPLDIEGSKAKDMYIDSITHTGDGNAIITGRKSMNRFSYITVINTEGKILHQKEMTSSCPTPFHFCAYLSQFKVVTVSWSNEISVYDVHDGPYINMSINNISERLPAARFFTCVAADPVNNHILVGGCDSRVVYVFDGQLKYKHTIKLPGIIKYPKHMAVSDGTLLVCDYQGGRAHAVSMEKLEGKVIHEFKKPIIDGDDWSPASVCRDKNGFVYMLWKQEKSGESRCLLVQYSQDFRQIQTLKPIDNDARCLTTLETIEAEKLLIATEKSGKLYIYDVGRLRVL